MEQRDSLLGVISTISKYIRYIIAISAIVAIGSVIVVLLLPVYYQSYTTFLAVNPDLLTERGLFGTTTRDPQPFGTNNDNDRLISIAESAELQNYLIDEFDLYTHYDIDTSSVKAPYYIRLALADLFEVKRTKMDAIQLSIEDKDPIIAASMATSARRKINSINLQMVKALQQSQVSTIEQSLIEKQGLLAILSDSTQALRSRYGVYNIDSQSESLSTLIMSRRGKLSSSTARLEALKNNRRASRDSILYLEATVQGITKEVESLQADMEKFNQGMSKVQALEEEYEEASMQVIYQKEQLKKLRTVQKSSLSSIFLLDEAAVPVVKSRPVRSLLVVAATLAAFVFSLIGVLIFEHYKDVNWKEILNGDE